jgi:hypothetical protein
MTKLKTLNDAAWELDAIRNDRLSAGANAAELIARVDVVGQWVAAKKNSSLVSKLVQEASQLHDMLIGGSGKTGIRLAI